MTRRRTHLFATTALAVATAFAASAAFAIAGSNDAMTWQTDSSTDARYPAAQGLSAPDQAPDSQLLNSSSDTDEDAIDSQDPSSATNQDMDSNDASSPDDQSSSDSMRSPDEDSGGASAAGVSATQASSTTLGSGGSEVAEAPSEDATAVSGGAVVMPTRAVYVFPPDQPGYTPETGDAQYGSKLDPTGPSANRFNDATGQ